MKDSKLDKIVLKDRIQTQSGWSKWVSWFDLETDNAEYPNTTESLT
jgi:hypothetical protein